MLLPLWPEIVVLRLQSTFAIAFIETTNQIAMKFLVFSSLLAVAAAFTTQPLTGPAKIADSPARARTATIVQSGKANGTLEMPDRIRMRRVGGDRSGSSESNPLEACRKYRNNPLCIA